MRGHGSLLKGPLAGQHMSEGGPFRRLLTFMRPHRGTVRLATFCSIVNKIWDLAPPLLIGLAVDVVVLKEKSTLAGLGVVDPWHQLVALSVLTFLIWGLESLFEYFYGVLWRNLAQTVQHELRLDTFDHVQKQGMAWFDDRQKGDILAILNDDINQLERFLDKGANDLLQVSTTVVVVGAVFLAISWQVALFAVLPIPLIVWGSFRYQRSREVVEILKQSWTQDEINYQGQVYNFQGLTTDPARPYQKGGPMLYFGGYSPDALELCGQHCDVYLMWPEPKDQIAERMKAANEAAARHNRTLDYGLRVHVIVRDTEQEAKEYARYIASKLDDEYGQAIRERALDSGSLGVSHQSKNRDLADLDGYIEPHLWTGVGRARSGCGAALVGSTDQILSELETYQKMGIRAFILSGYPHLDECKHFGSRVLPQMKTCSLPHAYGRVPAETPMTPLGAGERK